VHADLDRRFALTVRQDRMGDERRGAERKPGLQRLAAGETFNVSSSRLWVTLTTLVGSVNTGPAEARGGDYIVLRGISIAPDGQLRAASRPSPGAVIRRPYGRSVAHPLR